MATITVTRRRIKKTSTPKTASISTMNATEENGGIVEEIEILIDIPEEE